MREARRRRLGDLVSIGEAMLRDFERLGVTSVEQLALEDPDELYARISSLDGELHDPCVLDTYRAAVAQARDPELPEEQRSWWWWSRKRKAEEEALRPSRARPGSPSRPHRGARSRSEGASRGPRAAR
jgi:hypothetical protein